MPEKLRGMRGVMRELRLAVSEFLLSCALDIAPRDSRLRYELAIWLKDFIQKEMEAFWKPPEPSKPPMEPKA